MAVQWLNDLNSLVGLEGAASLFLIPMVVKSPVP